MSISFKILLIGDSNTGKSTLSSRYVDDTYTSQYISTKGIELKIHALEKNQKKIKLQIIDTGGSKQFESVTVAYLKTCHAVIYNFDLSQQSSLDSIAHWIHLTQKTKQSSPSCSPLLYQVLCGNKSDLMHKNGHQKMEDSMQKQVNELCENYAINLFVETSSKLNQNISFLFDDIVSHLLIHPNAPLEPEGNSLLQRKNSQNMHLRNPSAVVDLVDGSMLQTPRPSSTVPSPTVNTNAIATLEMDIKILQQENHTLHETLEAMETKIQQLTQLCQEEAIQISILERVVQTKSKEEKLAVETASTVAQNKAIVPLLLASVCALTATAGLLFVQQRRK